MYTGYVTVVCSMSKCQKVVEACSAWGVTPGPPGLCYRQSAQLSISQFGQQKERMVSSRHTAGGASLGSKIGDGKK